MQLGDIYLLLAIGIFDLLDLLADDLVLVSSRGGGAKNELVSVREKQKRNDNKQMNDGCRKRNEHVLNTKHAL
jgi:hypothetical protein